MYIKINPASSGKLIIEGRERPNGIFDDMFKRQIIHCPLTVDYAADILHPLNHTDSFNYIGGWFSGSDVETSLYGGEPYITPRATSNGIHQYVTWASFSPDRSSYIKYHSNIVKRDIRPAPLSFGCSFRANSIGNNDYGRLFQKNFDYESPTSFGMYFEPNGLLTAFIKTTDENVDVAYTCDVEFSNGVWYNVYYVYSGNGYGSFYVDVVETGFLSQTVVLPISSTTAGLLKVTGLGGPLSATPAVEETETFFIGARRENRNHFDGDIRDIRVYQIALNRDLINKILYGAHLDESEGPIHYPIVPLS